MSREMGGLQHSSKLDVVAVDIPARPCAKNAFMAFVKTGCELQR